MRAAVLTVLAVLLAAAGAARANVAAPVYPSDPGYGRAKFAAEAAPAVTLAAVVLAAGLFFRARSSGAITAAFVFGVLTVLWWGFIRTSSPPTWFPPEPGPGGPAAFGREPGSPRGATGDEALIAGLFALAGLCTGALALCRMVAGRGSPPPAEPVGPADPSP
jgi:hypothetical protein